MHASLRNTPRLSKAEEGSSAGSSGGATTNRETERAPSPLAKLAGPNLIATKPEKFQIVSAALGALRPSKIQKTVGNAFAEFNRHLNGDEISHDREILKERMSSRVLAAFALGEVVGTFMVAPLVGLASQLLTKDPRIGILATQIGDYFGAMISFIPAFYLLNRKMYQASSEKVLGRIKNFCKDCWPFAVGALGLASGLYAIENAMAQSFVSIFPNLSKFIPMAGPITVMNIVAGEAIYLTSTTIAFQTYSQGVLTTRALARYPKNS